MTVKEAMTNIANKIRDKLGINDKIRLTEIPDYIDNACDQSYFWGEGAGYSNGYDEGYDEGYGKGDYDGYWRGWGVGVDQGQLEGEQAEYDRFWDTFQNNGKRTNYTYAFWGPGGWNDDIYNPKYPLTIAAANQLFYANTNITDTKVLIDLTQSPGNITALFSGASNLVTVNKLIVVETNKYTNTFDSCKALKNIIFEGKIGRDINLQWSPLTLESALSIVNHLFNYTGEDGSDTYTITLNSSVWALLDAWMQEQPVLGELYSNAREWIESEMCWLTA